METLRTKILGFALLLAGLALCGTGLWLLLSPSQYQATTRIKLYSGANADINGNEQNASYDPYFIQTEFEIFQSQIVLDKVINALNLNVEWGKKYSGGATLTTNETIAILKSHLNFALVRNTRLIEISFTSEDPNEAAAIANAIAEAYRDYRMKLHQELATNGLQGLEQSYQKDEEKIRVLQTNVELLGEELKITNDVSSPAALQELQREKQIDEHEAIPSQPYWEEKRKLNQMIDFHNLLAAKIKSEKLDLQIPKTSMVEIVDVAKPPKFPVSPDRSLGAALLAVGLFPALGGLLLIKASRRGSAIDGDKSA